MDKMLLVIIGHRSSKSTFGANIKKKLWQTGVRVLCRAWSDVCTIVHLTGDFYFLSLIGDNWR